SNGDCLTRLLADTVDVMSTDDIILAGFASENSELTLVGGQFTKEPYGVGFPHANIDFAAFVDSVIQRTLNNGRWGRSYYEYLSDIPGLPPVDAAKATVQNSRN